MTGGGAGIGRAISVALAREGAAVAVGDVDAAAAEATAAAIDRAGGSALPIRADVTDPASVETMVRTVMASWGRLNVLVNNARVGTEGNVVELSLADWWRVLEVNLTGAFLCCKHAIPALEHSGGGAIVNVASISAVVGGSVSCVYPASKGGLVAFGKSTALSYSLRDSDFKAALLANYPMGRLSTAEEVASAVVFLESDEASFITGTELIVDGGYTAQ